MINLMYDSVNESVTPLTMRGDALEPLRTNSESFHSSIDPVGFDIAVNLSSVAALSAACKWFVLHLCCLALINVIKFDCTLMTCCRSSVTHYCDSQ